MPDDSKYTDPPFQGHSHSTHEELLRATQRLRSRLGQHKGTEEDDWEDGEAAMRWRRALLRLSETFLDAAEERRDLSPILLGALHNALEQLLIHGEEADLMALEEWLEQESPVLVASGDPTAADLLMTGQERRTGSDRREADRRAGERRSREQASSHIV